MKHSVFKSISKRARKLLGRAEGLDVEFKLQVNGLDSADIVAFANSESGGAILVGISEQSDGKVVQNLEIIGCEVGDKEKQVILSKAQSCIPPIEIDLFVENLGGRPFFRIEIPGGREKPYCTAGGTYKIRGDGRTDALLPHQILKMFVESESEKFVKRFQEATRQLLEEMKQIKDNLSDELEGIYRNIEKLKSSE